jgi:hypothetical protein
VSKKDFELIARVLRESHLGLTFEGRITREGLAREFADALADTNLRFDYHRFIAACVGKDSHDSAGRTVRYSR